MQVWQLQEAKAKLTELINDTKDEPQIISRRGVNEVVVINMKKFAELCKTQESIVSFFKNSPLNEIEVEFDRDKHAMREIDL